MLPRRSFDPLSCLPSSSWWTGWLAARMAWLAPPRSSLPAAAGGYVRSFWIPARSDGAIERTSATRSPRTRASFTWMRKVMNGGSCAFFYTLPNPSGWSEKRCEKRKKDRIARSEGRLNGARGIWASAQNKRRAMQDAPHEVPAGLLRISRFKRCAKHAPTDAKIATAAADVGCFQTVLERRFFPLRFV